MTATDIYWLKWTFVYISIVITILVAIWNMAKSELILDEDDKSKADLKKSNIPKFFTFLPEGVGTIAVKGDSLHKVIISSRSYVLKKVPVTRIDEDGTEKTVEVDKILFGEPEVGLLVACFGMYWMGVYPFIKRLIYPFAWSEWSDLESAKQDEIQHKIRLRKEATDFFYVKTFDYATKLESAECEGNVPVTLEISLFIRIVFPEIALFWNENWLKRVQDYALREARMYVGGKEFDALKKVSEESGHSSFAECLKKLNAVDKEINGKIKREGIIETIGVEIVDAKIIKVSLVGDEAGESAKAMMAVKIAEQYAKAATEDAKRITREYEAAEAVPGGMHILALEKVAKTNLISYGGKQARILAGVDTKTKKGDE